jgi:hypothetical protein
MKRLALLLLLPSCAIDPETTATYSSVSKVPELDLDGMPDLFVREDILESKWMVRDQVIESGSCESIEGNIQPGRRRVVKFAVGVANIGTADLVIGDPNNAVNEGLFEYAECHQHYHFRNYAKYELVSSATSATWRAAKRGFCMIDVDKNGKDLGAPDRGRIFEMCGGIGIPGYQGISRGWTDTYGTYLPGQYFVIDGGDGQPAVPAGNYILRITANPPFTAQGGEPCPYTDGAGFCHMLPESNYNNNVTELPVAL